MSIRYLDISELNERLAELEGLRDELNEAREALEEANKDSEESDIEQAELRVVTAEEAFSYDEEKELSALESLKDDIGERDGKIDDEGGPFIHENDFEDYARKFAEEIGAIDHGASWPMTCIDWSKAADELRMDYSAIEWGGVSYYYRA